MDAGDDKREERAGLPVALADAGKTASLARMRPAAAFLAQLLAARGHLAPQRARGRAAGGEAAQAYAEVDASDVKRLPAGYRRTVDA